MSNIYALILSTILLTGCAGSYKPITQVDLKAYQTITTTSLIHQEEIQKKVTLANSGGAAGAQFGFIGGLVGAIVDSAINDDIVEAAEKEMEPFRALMSDFDAREVINSELRNSLDKLNWSKIISFESEGTINTKEIQSKLSTIQGDLWLSVNTTYKFAEHLEYIEVTSTYSLYPSKVEGGSKKKKVSKPSSIYSNTVVFTSEDLTSLSKEQRQEIWKANNGEKMKASIREAATEIAQLIVMDLNGENNFTAEQLEKGKLQPIVISDTKERRLERNTNGWLSSKSNSSSR